MYKGPDNVYVAIKWFFHVYLRKWRFSFYL
jgi:hypothetical protein